MAKWIRVLGTEVMPSSEGTHLCAMVFSEVLQMLGFTRTDNGDPAWTGNRLIDEAGGGGVGTGFEVDALKPREVYDTQGRFTQSMVDNQATLFLFGGLLNDDQNQSAWRITEFIDANHVKVEGVSWNPYGWVTDTQLGGVVMYANTVELLNGAWAEFDCPPAMGRYRVRIYFVNNGDLQVSVAPMYNDLVVSGNGTTDAIDATGLPTCKITLADAVNKLNKHMVGLNVTIAGATNALDNGTFPITAVDVTTGEISYTNGNGVGEAGFSGTATVDGITTFSTAIQMSDYYLRRMRFNMYADDEAIHMYWTQRQSNNSGIYNYGWLSFVRLSDTAVGDTEPIVVMGDADTGEGRRPWYQEIQGLNGDVVPAVLQHWMTFFKYNRDTSADDNFFMQFALRLVNGPPGKLMLVEPWLTAPAGTSDGGFIRGRFTKFRVGYTGMERFRPIDSAGTWVHFQTGHFYPRNGPEDNLPMLTEW